MALARRTPRAPTEAPAVPDDADPADPAQSPGDGPGSEWPVPEETDLPHTGPVCTTVAMLLTREMSISGGFTSVEDIIPVGSLATG